MEGESAEQTAQAFLTAWQSGDISGAQQALSTIRSRPLAGDLNAATEPQVASPKIAPTDQSAPGGTIDLIV